MTSVDFFKEELEKHFVIRGNSSLFDKILKQAKEKHKEQIVTAHYQGYRNDIGTTEVSEQYYNETFKSE
jgi:hypothetical protein